MVSLTACKLFNGLNARELNTLRGLCKVENFPAGHEIFREGDAGDAVYVIRAGSVEILAQVNADKREVMSRLGPGEFFGEMSVIEFKPRSATAVAATPVTVYRIPAGEMMTFIHHTPDIAVNLMREMSHRLRAINTRHVEEISQTERLKLLGQFARSIIHDLKNPLSIIGLTAEMAAAENASSEFRTTAARRIQAQAQRISELVGEVLEFAQGSSGSSVLAPVDYAAFVGEVIEELREELEMKGVAIHFENEPPSVPLLINPRRLRRVFHNLLHNAAQAMPAGGIVIMRFSLKQARVITEIEDTGTGIPLELIPKLFEPFAQSGKQGGSGLGLSICRKIIEDHKGRIWPERKPGRGAIFVFSIPRPA